MADIFTLKTKNQLLLDFSKSLKYRQMVVFSDQGNLLDRSYLQTESQFRWPSAKPVGLWYCYGPAWMEFLTNDYKMSLEYDVKNDLPNWQVRRLNGYTHVYQIYLNRKKILHLNESNWEIFDKRYGGKSKGSVYWHKLEEDGWCGINIRLNKIRSKIKKYWYFDWDVSGGCIWNRDGLRKVKLLKAFNSIWYEER